MQITFKQNELTAVTRMPLFLSLYMRPHERWLIYRLMDLDENTVYVEILIVIITKATTHLNKKNVTINNLICGRLQMTVVAAEVTLTV